MNNMKIHHIGYLVKSIEKSKSLFLSLGYDLEQDTVYDVFRKVDICFLIKDGYRIELVSPKDSSSVVGELRKKVGNSPYHICYEVESLEDAVSALAEKRFVVWDEPHEAPAINGKKVIFLVNGQIGMIELVEA